MRGRQVKDVPRIGTAESARRWRYSEMRRRFVIKRFAAHRRSGAKSWKSDLSPRNDARETKGGRQIFFARIIYRGGQRHFRSEIQTKRARVRNFFRQNS